MLKKIFVVVLVGISQSVFSEQVNFGEYSEVTGGNAAVFGSNTIAKGANSAAFGDGGVAHGDNTAVFGKDNLAYLSGSAAFGLGTQAFGYNSVTFGLETMAGGANSAAFGANSVTRGKSSAAFGDQTEANGDSTVSFGVGSRASGKYSAAFGTRTITRGNASAAFGLETVANGDYSASFGHSTIAQARDQFVAGQYNYQFPDVDPVTEDLYDPLFVIGNGVDANATSNAITVFRNGHTVIHGRMTAMQGITTGSDERLKNSILPLVDSLDKVRQLQGVSYLLDSDAEQKTQVGFIAQEMEQVVPEVVHEGRDGYLSIAYGQLTPLLVESVKTIDSKVESMDSKFKALEQENSQLKAALCEIKATLILCD